MAFLACGRFWVNDHAHIIRGNRNADTRFLMYALTIAEIDAYLTGSTMPKLTQGNLNRIPVPAPPLREQRAIAGILGALDDKIELNRQMNETLEAMAQALFKSWFVDFDPVRAKAEGRDPGMTESLADLFPGRLLESELGEIPNGWRHEPLLRHARLISGGTPKTDNAEYWNGDVPWASAKDVSQSSTPFLIATERSITEKGLNQSAARIVPKFSTVVVARGATTGRFRLFGRDIAMNQTCYALHHQRPFRLSLTFATLVDRLVHAAHGSVFDTITTRTLEGETVLLASDKVMDAFEAVSPLYRRVLLNCEASVTLAAMRDALLPKLIAGELRVKDAERLVAEAAA